jgi:hypothetical protein
MIIHLGVLKLHAMVKKCLEHFLTLIEIVPSSMGKQNISPTFLRVPLDLGVCLPKGKQRYLSVVQTWQH